MVGETIMLLHSVDINSDWVLMHSTEPRIDADLPRPGCVGSQSGTRWSWGVGGAMTLMLEEDALSAFCSAGDIELDFHVRDAPEASVATLLSACASTSKLSSPKRPRSHSRTLDCVGPHELIARKYGTAAPLFAFRTTALVMMAKCLGTSSKWGRWGMASLWGVGISSLFSRHARMDATSCILSILSGPLS